MARPKPRKAPTGVPAVIVRDPNKHDRDRHRKLYGVQDMTVNEDLADPVVRLSWPRYKILPDGRQGPLPFQSMAERREFFRRYPHLQEG